MRKIAVGFAVLVVTICGIAVAPAALASTVDVTVDCHHSVNVQARVGDTVVFHLTSNCSLLGVITDGGEIYPQNTNPAFRGFLGPISAVNSSDYGTDWLFPGMWYAYSDGSGTTTVTTTIVSTNGNGDSLAPGSTLGTVDPSEWGSYGIYFEQSAAPGSNLEWQQAIGRASASTPCPEGYTGSWDLWPNNHTGGYVCNRFVPEYGD